MWSQDIEIKIDKAVAMLTLPRLHTVSTSFEMWTPCRCLDNLDTAESKLPGAPGKLLSHQGPQTALTASESRLHKSNMVSTTQMVDNCVCIQPDSGCLPVYGLVHRQASLRSSGARELTSVSLQRNALLHNPAVCSFMESSEHAP